jgi:WD40 repeat protein
MAISCQSRLMDVWNIGILLQKRYEIIIAKRGLDCRRNIINCRAFVHSASRLEKTFLGLMSGKQGSIPNAVMNPALTMALLLKSLNESFFCVGSSSGAIYVFNLHTGKQITELQHRRSTKAVRCCVFTRDCR